MTPETTVWHTRHAETSAPFVFHGAESDIGLSALGEQQAAAAAEWFAPRGVTAVVSSAMRRAVDTARPIAAICGAPHHVVPELHERKVGELTGTAFSMDGGPWPDTVARWVAGETTYTTPGAESFDDLRQRLLPAWDRVVADHAGGRVVVVAHGVVCKVLLVSLLAGWGPRRWVEFGRVANLAVSEVVGRPGDWRAGELLVVPPGVAEVTAAAAQIPAAGRKSEA